MATVVHRTAAVERAARERILVRPWLPRVHPNFFVIYTATIIYYLWSAYLGIFNRASFDSPLFDPVNAVAPSWVWGIAYGVIGVGLYVGLHFTSFRISRLFLAAGLALVTFRLALFFTVELWGSTPVGNSLPNLFLCAALHLSQTLEPPANPESARDPRRT